MARFLSIHEVAEQVNRTPNTLRQWERHGRITAAPRDSNGWRYYPPALVEEIRKSIYPDWAATEQPQTNSKEKAAC